MNKGAVAVSEASGTIRTTRDECYGYVFYKTLLTGIANTKNRLLTQINSLASDSALQGSSDIVHHADLHNFATNFASTKSWTIHEGHITAKLDAMLRPLISPPNILTHDHPHHGL